MISFSRSLQWMPTIGLAVVLAEASSFLMARCSEMPPCCLVSGARFIETTVRIALRAIRATSYDLDSPATGKSAGLVSDLPVVPMCRG